MTEPWTARQRDQLLTRVSRATVLSGAVALVATAGISYGLASATTAATLASGSSRTASSASTPGTTAAQSSTSQSSAVQSATAQSTSVSSSSTGTAVSASVGAPVATSGGS